MKVLFVCSGNSINGISPITLNQGNSLEAEGIFIQYFTIKGKGLINYIKAIFQLRKFLEKNHFDIIHAPLLIFRICSWIRYWITCCHFTYGK